MSSDYAVYRQLVAQLMQGNEVLPSLPSLTLKIRTALHDPSTTNLEIEQLISRDPALSALLLKHASSALYRQERSAENLRDVINLLGMKQLTAITMAHSVKSLFTLCSAAYKKLFIDAWGRLVIKAATCSVMARKIGRIAPEHALLASLLSEVGSLVLLSAFRMNDEPPSSETYYRLCREFSKSLGILLLKRWGIEGEYVQIIRQTGDWFAREDERLQTIDLVNLSLHFAIQERDGSIVLPPLTEITAYKKLPMPFNQLDEQGHLKIITDHQYDIQDVAQMLR